MHQHGPNCQHGQGHGGPGNHHGSRPAAGQNNHGAHQCAQHGHGPHQQPSQYFKNLKNLWKVNRQFFWTQVLAGNVTNNLLDASHLGFLKTINCNFLAMVIMNFEMMCNFQCLPIKLKSLLGGLFIPLLLIFVFNYSLTVGFAGSTVTQNDVLGNCVSFGIYLCIFLYICTAIRGSGSLSTPYYEQLTKAAINQRPYLQNPQMNWKQANILKVFRSMYCPICQQCTPKFSRHSVVFHSCIGAANQLAALLFFISLAMTQLLIIIKYLQNPNQDFITTVIFLTINISICWNSFIESLIFLISNIWYGITEHEVRTWVFQQYLIKPPMRQFQNNLKYGFIHNLTQIVYAFCGIKGYQSEKVDNMDMVQQSEVLNSSGLKNQFKKLDKNKKYIVNWEYAFFYLIPQLPNYPNRDSVIQNMMRDQPKLIQNFRLMKKFKAEVLQESKGQLSDMEIQQKVMLKMQYHMMESRLEEQNNKYPKRPQVSTSQQQRIVQMQILEHLTKELVGHPEHPQIIKLLEDLKQQKITGLQANKQLGRIQQSIMKRRVEDMLNQRKKLKQNSQKIQNGKINEREQNEEEPLKSDMPDQKT